MPSLIIHLAIAKRHAELHPNEISSLSDFQKGSIAPDLSNDFSRILSKPEKAITHYYDQPEGYKTNFDLFKQDKKINLTNDYWKGYYAHLLADYLFYLIYFKQEVNHSFKDNMNLYDDFTILTSRVIEDYRPTIDNSYMTSAVQQCLATKNGKCKYLDYAKIHYFIEKVATDLPQAIRNML